MLMLIFLSIMFISSVQPMVMVISLIMLTLLYSYMINKMMNSFWFSYMLVMVMLSGVLVVFTYMVSLMPNESFENYNLLMLFVLMLVCYDLWNFLFEVDYSYMSVVLWNSYVGLYNLFIVSFLLSMMLVVVWVSCMDEGAMRLG